MTEFLHLQGLEIGIVSALTIRPQTDSILANLLHALILVFAIHTAVVTKRKTEVTSHAYNFSNLLWVCMIEGGAFAYLETSHTLPQFFGQQASIQGLLRQIQGLRCRCSLWHLSFVELLESGLFVRRPSDMYNHPRFV